MHRSEEGSQSAVLRVVGAPARLGDRLCDKLCGTTRPPAGPLVGLFVVLVVALVVWDFYLDDDGIAGNTWSEVVRGASDRYPILPWLLAALIGHLFHPKDKLLPIIRDRDVANSLMFLLTLAAAVVGFVGVAVPWHQSITASGGLLAGVLLWPMPREGKWQW